MTRLRSADRRRSVALLFVACWILGTGLVWAAPPRGLPRTDAQGDLEERYYAALTMRQDGHSDSATRTKALAELPLKDLPPAARTKAQGVISNLALFRRLPVIDFAADDRVYQYLLTHPDISVSSWRAMDISQFELRTVQPNVYHADAKDGSVGTVEVWKSTREETLIYCDGAFKSPLLAKPIIARSVMRLTSRFYADAEGVPRTEHTGDIFVSFPSQTVETVAKLISPISHNIADRNFKQLTLYVHLMSMAMTNQPEWIAAMVERMDVADEPRRELLALSEQVHRAGRDRAVRAVSAAPMDEILAPLRRQTPALVIPVAAQPADVPMAVR
jgi:hypothetical protein